MFFRKTKKPLIKLLDNYLAQVDLCLENFNKSIQIYIQENNARSAKFCKLVEETHLSEALADDKRHEFELSLYTGKRLLPGSRSDILAILEAFDRLPNKAETILFIIQCQRITFPEELKDDLSNLFSINIAAYKAAKQAFVDFFENPNNIDIQIREIDKHESLSDRLERKIICSIFDKDDMETGTKLLLKELVINIGGLSDRCEIAGNIIMVNSVKRLV